MRTEERAAPAAGLSGMHLSMLAAAVLGVSLSGPLMAAATSVPALAMSFWRSGLGALAIAPRGLTRYRAELRALPAVLGFGRAHLAHEHAEALANAVLDPAKHHSLFLERVGLGQHQADLGHANVHSLTLPRPLPSCQGSDTREPAITRPI